MTEKNKRFTVLDLFAGAGGMALGFKEAGFRTIGALDIDQNSAATFQSVFSEEDPIVFGGPEEGDAWRDGVVDHVLDSLRGSPTVIVGGPPCQGFSQVGRAKNRSLLEDKERIRTGDVRLPERNHLYDVFMKFVATGRPQAFVIENVPGIRSVGGIDYAARIARLGEKLRYTVRYFLLNAAHYGVPQIRWRIFVVGLRNDLGLIPPEPPPRTHRFDVKPLEGSPTPTDRLMVWGDAIPEIENPEPATTARDALGDLPRLYSMGLTANGGKRPSSSEFLPLRDHPSPYASMMRTWGTVSEVYEVDGNWFRWTPRDFPIFEEMAEGDKYPEAYGIANRLFRQKIREHNSSGSATINPGSREFHELRKKTVPPYRTDTFPEKWKKLVARQPTWTLPAHLGRDSYSHIHYDSQQARAITIREAARLQSFPDFVRFAGNNGSQFQQIGNAVPPLLAKAVAESLMKQLKECHRPDDRSRARPGRT